MVLKCGVCGAFFRLAGWAAIVREGGAVEREMVGAAIFVTPAQACAVAEREGWSVEAESVACENCRRGS